MIREGNILTDIIRILVAEKNPALRTGLCSFLAAVQPKCEVIGETDNYKDLLGQIEQKQPHIIFLDISICKGKNEGIVLRSICRGKSSYHIVVMVDECALHCLIRYLSDGAKAVIAKNIHAEELELVIQQVIKQKRFISSELVDILVDYLCEQKSFTFGNEMNSLSANNDLNLFETLTEREREVLDLVAQGLSNKEIARHLSLSIGAIKFHLSNLMGKLQLENRVQATLFVLGRFPTNGHEKK